jgi:hypothetical protein
MPGETTAARPKRRFPVILILLMVLLVFAGLYAYPVFIAFRNDYDTQRIAVVVKRAILTHAKKGDRFPVTLRNGPRILRIDFSTVQPGALLPNSGPGPGPAETCVSYSLFDPKTGVADNSSRYAHVSCFEGIAYRIAP